MDQRAPDRVGTPARPAGRLSGNPENRRRRRWRRRMRRQTRCRDAAPAAPALPRLPRPRETVFKAWSSAEHVKRWFSPATYTVPDAKVEMRVGGAFDVCMRSPDGESTGPAAFRRGRAERAAGDRHARDRRRRRRSCSAPIPRSISSTRSAARGWTSCRPTPSSIPRSPRRWWRARRRAGAPRSTSWSGGRAHAGRRGDRPRSVVHATFHLERTYDAPVARVWRALTDEAAKPKWFGGPPGRWELLERTWTCASAGASG